MLVYQYGMNKNAIRKTAPFALLLAVIAALYGQFLWNPIVFDDLYFFMVDNVGEQPVSSYHFEWLQLRSLPYATLAWTKAWFGLDLINFRIGNLVLHAAVCCALYGFFSTVFTAVGSISGIGENPSVRPDRLSPQSMALIAALLFAVHPVATYAAGYLVQRTMLFATLFGWLALWVWVLGSVKQSTWVWLSVPLYYLAVFSKEHSVMLIMIFPLLTVLLNADWRQRLKAQCGVLSCLLLIAIFVALASKGVVGSVYIVNGSEELSGVNTKLPYPLAVLTQTMLFFKYALLWILPNPAWMAIHMPQSYATYSGFYLIAALAFLAWGGTGFWLLFKRGSLMQLGFAMLVPWLMFMVELSTVRIQDLFVLYRSYLWAAGALCAVPVILNRLPTRIAVTGAAMVVLMMFPLSMERLATMSHPVLLWEDAKQALQGRNDLPGSSLIYYNLGTEYLKADMSDKAIEELKLASGLAPNFAEAYGNLGAAYFKQSNWGDAASSFGQAVAINQKNGKPAGVRNLLGRAQAYENAGDIPKSQADYQESCRLAQRGCDKIR